MTIMIENLAEEISHVLKQHGLKLATAESCTGGGLAYWITSIAGSSAWFDRGFITYNNQAKIDLLGVSAKTLQQWGAVSKEVAHEMAEGALHHSQADIGIAITGIAGPDGSTAEKPVGTVWIAIASKKKSTDAVHNVFLGNRQAVRTRAIETALETLLEIVVRET